MCSLWSEKCPTRREIGIHLDSKSQCDLVPFPSEHKNHWQWKQSKCTSRCTTRTQADGQFKESTYESNKIESSSWELRMPSWDIRCSERVTHGLAMLMWKRWNDGRKNDFPASCSHEGCRSWWPKFRLLFSQEQKSKGRWSEITERPFADVVTRRAAIRPATCWAAVISGENFGRAAMPYSSCVCQAYHCIGRSPHRAVLLGLAAIRDSLNKEMSYYYRLNFLATVGSKKGLEGNEDRITNKKMWQVWVQVGWGVHDSFIRLS